MKDKVMTYVEAVAFVVGLAALIILFVGGVLLVSRSGCRIDSEQMGFTWKWHPVAGCLVQVEPDRWIPLANYRYMGE